MCIAEVKRRFGCDLHSRSVNTDLRQLRYFVAVAEELNFTRAAVRLHMTQQPLSAAIQRMESELGVTLFHRTTRRVELTDAGNALLEPARTAIRAVDDAFATARAAGSGIAGELQFGLSTGARYGLEPLFAALDQRFPAVHLQTRHDSAVPLLAALRAGRLDVAVTFAAQIPADLEHRLLKNEPGVLAVAADHPVAGRHSIRLSELRDETFALDIPGDNPDYDQAVIEGCRRAGSNPGPAPAPAFTTPGKVRFTPRAASGSRCAPRSIPPTATYDCSRSRTRRRFRSSSSGATRLARSDQRSPRS